MFPNLEFLYLNSNRFTGTVPLELGQCTRLEILDLQNNDLSGPIAPVIDQLTNLASVDLAENFFDGEIPMSHIENHCCPQNRFVENYSANQTCKCVLSTNSFLGCPKLPTAVTSCCNVIDSCSHTIPLPPAFPKLSAAGTTSMVVGSIGTGGVLALLPMMSHVIHAFASGILFNGQLMAMLEQLNVGWTGAFAGTQHGLRRLNFQFKGVTAATTAPPYQFNHGPPTGIPSAAEQIDLAPPQMFGVLLAELFFIGFVVAAMWSAIWLGRKRYKPTVDAQGSAAEPEEPRAAAAAGATATGNGRVLAVKDKLEGNSHVQAVKDKLLQVRSALSEDYRGGVDTCHWSALTLSCWFFDKLYMPIVTAASYHIVTVLRMTSIPGVYVFTAMVATGLLAVCMVWISVLWQLLDPTCHDHKKSRDDRATAALPAETFYFGGFFISTDPSLHADEEQMLPATSPQKRKRASIVSKVWHTLKTEPLYQTRQSILVAAKGTWASNVVNPWNIRLMACEFFLHRFLVGFTIGAFAYAKQWQVVLSWLISILFCCSIIIVAAPIDASMIIALPRTSTKTFTKVVTNTSTRKTSKSIFQVTTTQNGTLSDPSNHKQVDITADDVSRFTIGEAVGEHAATQGITVAILPFNGSVAPQHTGKGIVAIERAGPVGGGETCVTESKEQRGQIRALMNWSIALARKSKVYFETALRMLKQALRALSVRAVLSNEYVLGRACAMLAFMLSMINGATQACSDTSSTQCHAISDFTLVIALVAIGGPSLVLVYDKVTKGTDNEQTGEGTVEWEMNATVSNPAYADPVSGDTVPSAGPADTRTRSTTAAALEARQDPEQLIGQQVDVLGKGAGTVTGAKRSRGKPTMHTVAFDEGGAPQTLLLQKTSSGAGNKFHLVQ